MIFFSLKHWRSKQRKKIEMTDAIDTPKKNNIHHAVYDNFTNSDLYLYVPCYNNTCCTDDIHTKIISTLMIQICWIKSVEKDSLMSRTLCFFPNLGEIRCIWSSCFMFCRQKFISLKLKIYLFRKFNDFFIQRFFFT